MRWHHDQVDQRNWLYNAVVQRQTADFTSISRYCSMYLHCIQWCNVTVTCVSCVQVCVWRRGCSWCEPFTPIIDYFFNGERILLQYYNQIKFENNLHWPRPINMENISVYTWYTHLHQSSLNSRVPQITWQGEDRYTDSLNPFRPFHSLQAANCCRNSRLVVDEDDLMWVKK